MHISSGSVLSQRMFEFKKYRNPFETSNGVFPDMFYAVNKFKYLVRRL